MVGMGPCEEDGGVGSSAFVAFSPLVDVSSTELLLLLLLLLASGAPGPSVGVSETFILHSLSPGVTTAPSST